ncbi:LIM domain only protein 7 [Phlebotomus argentipes]|uniref:LIM domain only protein 7 n=1 Tax=Phlebotomus argentipes TaxID=94469 RepID=UPI00289364D5|nr:LIM domain only protein 7 [Phlebotomus argentipes]XP_059622170.1 LIM domain only protein 7 [Phlebotomus argentipes]
MPSESEQIAATSPTSPAKMATVTTTNGTNGIRERKSSTDGENNKGPSSANRISVTSHDPTDYVQRARTTRAAPPKPACNPMQFVKIKPCNLYQSAQEQLKRAEEVKKVKEVKKEDAEDWQCNLDNWKSSRRKRVEHIIDRVVEVKKLELEEHERTRRKSKTFSEMLEERGTRRKMPLAVYNEDDANDFSDLGIGTSSASGKSSLSEDFDNHSVISDNQDTEKSHSDVENNSNHENGNHRDYVSSPGYDTSSSTAPASSPDPCEYTYEGAIEGYKLRISRAQSIGFNGFNNGRFSKDSTPERASSLDSGRSSGHENGVSAPAFVPKRPSVTKIEERLINFELKSSSDSAAEGSNVAKKDLPKVDIGKRREMFEKDKPAAVTIAPMESTVQKRLSGDFSNAKSIRERLSSFEQVQKEDGSKKANRLSGDLSSIKERLSILEKEKKTTGEKPLKVDVPVVSLKDRLTSLHSAVSASSVVSAKQEVHDESIAETPAPECVETPQESVVPMDLEPDCEDSESQQVQETVQPTEDDLTPSTLVESTPVSPVQSDPTPVDVNHDDTLLPAEVTSNELFDDNCASDLTEQDTSVLEALDIAFQAIDGGDQCGTAENEVEIEKLIDELVQTPIASQAEPESQSEAEETMDAVKTISEEKIQKALKASEPIYEIIDDVVEQPESKAEETLIDLEDEEEPYYQVPKPVEPYYEVPKSKPIPLYENVEIFMGASRPSVSSSDAPTVQPPKEKPPPPPVEDDATDDEGGNEEYEEDVKPDDAMKRMNSTRRIKKEIRNKRSSFLGIEGSTEDDISLELSVAPPPDMSALLQEERRLEKQVLFKTGLYESSDTGDSRDSGVSENHSRQSSEPFTTSSEEQEDYLAQKETEIIKVLMEEKEKRRSSDSLLHESKRNGPEEWTVTGNGFTETESKLTHCGVDEESRMRCLEEQIREQEEVLRVERELLQLEQEELKRQRENLLLRENLARKELDHGTKMLMSANRRSLQDLNSVQSTVTVNQFANVSAPHPVYPIPADYRQSMPDLQQIHLERKVPPTPPAKPMRSNLIHQEFQTARESSIKASRAPSADASDAENRRDDAVQLRRQPAQQHVYGNMSRHTLHALSAVPKPKLTDGWVQQNRKSEPTEKYYPIPRKNDFVKAGTRERITNDSSWIAARKSEPRGFSYGKHWLIQEAEQRRIDQQLGVKPTLTQQNGWGTAQRRSSGGDGKPLPDSVIQTLTQRVQNRMSVNERRRLETNGELVTQQNLSPESQEKILSVSGRKKCSHCGDELGRGAAMIIESLRLFFHIDCFKCCVCRVQLGDGLNGTDVRVRNHKLHCHNCYSSDDGVKFSCV